MQIFYWLLLVISWVGLGFSLGRKYTKVEFGKMLVWMEDEGYLKRPDDFDDDEDFK